MREQVKIIDRYLGWNTLQGFLLVLSVLVVIFSFLELLIQINDLGKGTYRLPHAFLFVALTIPKRIVDLMPVAALLGSIVALGLLADHQELTAMQAAGISVQRIALPVLATSMLLMLAAIIIAEFLAPPLDQHARFMRSRAIYGKGVMMSKEGFWVRQGRSFVHVGQALSHERAADIEIYELDDAGRLRQFISAKHAVIQNGQDWLLTDIQAKEFKGDNVIVKPIDQYRLASFLTPAQVSTLELPPDSLSLSDLWRFIRSLRERSENAKAYALVFWQKVCLPLTTGVMVLFSLTFIFGSTRIRNASQRIFAGMMVGVLFYFANQIFGHLGLILDLPPLFTTLAPVSILLLAALKLLHKAF